MEDLLIFPSEATFINFNPMGSPKEKPFEKSLSLGHGCSTICQWARLFEQGGKRALMPKYQYQASRCRTPFTVIQIIIFLQRLLHWGGK